MANPVQAFVSTYRAGLVTTNSGYMTFSFANTGGFDVVVPIEFQLASHAQSAGAEVWVWRSTDGGASWETEGSLATAFTNKPAAASTTWRKDIILDTGQYLIGVLGAGDAQATYSCSAALGTAWVITAYV